jgi:hypothetical protein
VLGHTKEKEKGPGEIVEAVAIHVEDARATNWVLFFANLPVTPS